MLTLFYPFFFKEVKRLQEQIADKNINRRLLCGVSRSRPRVRRQYRPAGCDSHPGFRFERAFLSEEGLEYEGFVVGVIKDDQLFLICYSGTREYYFPKYKETAEQIIISIHMPEMEIEPLSKIVTG